MYESTRVFKRMNLEQARQEEALKERLERRKNRKAEETQILMITGKRQREQLEKEQKEQKERQLAAMQDRILKVREKTMTLRTQMKMMSQAKLVLPPLTTLPIKNHFFALFDCTWIVRVIE